MLAALREVLSQLHSEFLGAVPDNLVPAHPIAGAEQSGVEASINDLFLNKRLIITPLGNTRTEACKKFSVSGSNAGL